MRFACLKLPRVAVTVVCGFAAAAARAVFPLPPAATGDVYVSSFGTDEVVCFDREGRFRFRFGHRDLDGPRGLAFSARGDLYAAAQSSDRVLVFTPEGAYVRQFSAPGLDGPTSLAFGPDAKLYAASFSTDEVFVFASEAFERRFSAPGLNGPNCIAFAPGGGIYVASQLDSRVYRFDAGGGFVSRFTGGGLSSAMGIAVFAGRLHVTGGASDTVAVFDLDGNLLHNLSTRPEVSGPQGIAFDDRGDYVTASFYTGDVAQYRQDGSLVRVFERAGIATARSVAFLPLDSGPEEAFIRGDFNRDGGLDLSDAVATIGYLFLGAASSGCLDAADSNDDGRLDTSDAVYVLAHLFLGGAQPPAPYPEAGGDPTTEDALRCRPRV
jgi:DNA-binding beta-propeller fold protein YncE